MTRTIDWQGAFNSIAFKKAEKQSSEICHSASDLFHFGLFMPVFCARHLFKCRQHKDLRTD